MSLYSWLNGQTVDNNPPYTIDKSRSPYEQDLSNPRGSYAEPAFKVDGGVRVQIDGLGSAAYANASAFDVSGAATEVYNAILPLTNNEIDALITSIITG